MNILNDFLYENVHNVFMNTLNLRKHLTIISILFIGIIFYHLFLYSQLPLKETVWNNLYGLISSLIYFYGAFIGIMGARAIGFSSTIGRSLAFLSLASLLYAVGVSIWGYLATFTAINVDELYPSVADNFYLMYYPLSALGVIMLLKMYKIKINFKTVLQLTVLIGISFFITQYFLDFLNYDAEVSAYENFITTAYSLGDLILISISLITIFLAGGKIIKALILIVFSFLVQAGGDFYFSYLEDNELFWDGHFADFLFTLSGFLLTLGIIEIIKRFRVGSA